MGEIYQTKDCILYNGNIFTMDKKQPQAKVIKISDGIITYVGNDKGSIDPFTTGEVESFDLKGKTVFPGFIDTHMHPVLYGLSLLEIDCRAITTGSIDEIKKSIRFKAEETDSKKWLIGWGWDDSKLKEKRNPTRWDLDEAAPHHPVLLKRTCGHVAVVNSKALEKAGISKETLDPEGGHIVKDPNTGEPNGILQERAIELIRLPEKTLAQTKEGLALAMDDFNKWGFTTIHDMSCTGMNMSAYQDLLAEEKLTVRMRPWFWALDQMEWAASLDHLIAQGIKSGFGNDMLRIQGVKLMLDGSVGGRTAALTDPYEGESENKGILFMSEKQFTDETRNALENDLRVAVHAIGERAIEICLKAIEVSKDHTSVEKMRNRIEHCALPTEDQLKRIKNLNLIAGSSVGFVYWLGDSYIKNLGKQRTKRAYPQKTFKEYGITAPANSDVPICDGDPMASIYAAVTRKTLSGETFDTEQNVSVMDAVRSYTTDAAYASFEESHLGSLAPGKVADLIVLTENPFKIRPENLKDIKVDMTMMNGNITHKM